MNITSVNVLFFYSHEMINFFFGFYNDEVKNNIYYEVKI